jgi:hypothetical protein
VNIKVVTFNDHIALGEQYVPIRTIAQGDRYGTGKMYMTNYQKQILQIFVAILFLSLMIVCWALNWIWMAFLCAVVTVAASFYE